MPRKRLHKDQAARQRAYEERKKARNATNAAVFTRRLADEEDIFGSKPRPGRKDGYGLARDSTGRFTKAPEKPPESLEDTPERRARDKLRRGYVDTPGGPMALEDAALYPALKSYYSKEQGWIKPVESVESEAKPSIGYSSVDERDRPCRWQDKATRPVTPSFGNPGTTLLTCRNPGCTFTYQGTDQACNDTMISHIEQQKERKRWVNTN